jgi:hypothetical protein
MTDSERREEITKFAEQEAENMVRLSSDLMEMSGEELDEGVKQLTGFIGELQREMERLEGELRVKSVELSRNQMRLGMVYHQRHCRAVCSE